MAWCDGPQGVGNVEAEVDVLVGRLRGGSGEFCCQLRVRTESNVELPWSDGWLECLEEFQNDRALNDLDEGLLECDGKFSWLPAGLGC